MSGLRSWEAQNQTPELPFVGIPGSDTKYDACAKQDSVLFEFHSRDDNHTICRTSVGKVIF